MLQLTWLWERLVLELLTVLRQTLWTGSQVQLHRGGERVVWAEWAEAGVLYM